MKKHFLAVIIIAAVTVIPGCLSLNTKPAANPSIYRKIAPVTGAILLSERIKKNEMGGHFKVLIEIAEDAAHDKDRVLNAIISNISHWQRSYRFGNFCTATISLPDVLLLARSPSIKSILILDYSSSPAAVRTSPPLITGIIDHDFDWSSKAFCFKNGDTRILYYWDQQAAREGAPPNPGAATSYGIEYSRCRLEQMKRSSAPIVPGKLGHGMLSALVAAGNVAIEDEQEHLLMSGQAPDSWIILVNTSGKKGDILDAIAYISKKAGNLGARCVIDLSFGKHFGPHREGQLFVRSLDALLGDRSLLVVSSGNDREQGIAFQRELGKIGELDIPFHISMPHAQAPAAGKKFKAVLEFWYPDSLNLEVSLISPGNNRYGPVKNGTYRVFVSKDGKLMLTNSFSAGSVNYKSIQVTLRANDRQLPPAGKWNIRLKRISGGDNKHIRGWVMEAHSCSASFAQQEYWTGTVSSLTFGKSIISAGAFMRHQAGYLIEAPYSNFDCVDEGELKPHVLTLGRLKVWEPEMGLFVNYEGTSASASLLTRYITFAWAKFPRLQAQAVKSALIGKALVSTDEYPLPGWKGKHGYRVLGIDELPGIFQKVKESEQPGNNR